MLEEFFSHVVGVKGTAYCLTCARTERVVFDENGQLKTRPHHHLYVEKYGVINEEGAQPHVDQTTERARREAVD